MPDNDIIISAVDKYVKHWLFYMIVSLVITLPTLAGIFIIIYIQEMSIWFYLLICFCFSVSTLFATYVSSFATGSKPSDKGRAILASSMWAAALTFVCATFRQIMRYGINKWIICIVFGIIMWVVGCMVILTMCHIIKSPGIRFFDMIWKKKKMFWECVVITAIWFCAGMFGVTAFAMPGKYARNIPAKETILIAEKVLRLLLLYAFIPFYILTFTSLYEHMLSEKE